MCLRRKPPFEQAGYMRRALFLTLALSIQVDRRKHHTRQSTNWPNFGSTRGPIHRPRVFWRSASIPFDLQIVWETGANRPGSGTKIVLVMIHQTMTTGIVRWRDGQPDMAQSRPTVALSLSSDIQFPLRVLTQCRLRRCIPLSGLARLDQTAGVMVGRYQRRGGSLDSWIDNAVVLSPEPITPHFFFRVANVVDRTSS